MKATEARKKLNALASPEVAASSTRFFKTGPGQYGEGDIFIGVRVPDLRKLAREFRDLPLAKIEALLRRSREAGDDDPDRPAGEIGVRM